MQLKQERIYCMSFNINQTISRNTQTAYLTWEYIVTFYQLIVHLVIKDQIYFNAVGLARGFSWSNIMNKQKQQQQQQQKNTQISNLVRTAYSIFSFMCMFCRSLFVLLYFFFWPLCCLFFFDIQCTDSDYPLGISKLFLDYFIPLIYIGLRHVFL